MRQYPELKVSLMLEDRLTDLQAEGIDIAVRIGEMADSSLVATPITVIPKICCAAPAYLEQRGTPAKPQELVQHSLLHYSNISKEDEWSWLYGDGAKQPDLPHVFASNHAEALREMAVQGMGITVLPEFIVEESLQRGQLVQLFKELDPAPLPLHAVRPSRQFTPARVRAFIDFLKASFAA
jgi:DNA-binding transcriptional LysR family regulator